MITTAMGGILFRTVSEQHKAGLADGTLKIFGSAIREVSTGRIRGFLQEAAPLQKLFPALLKLAPSGVDLATAPLEVAQLVQGEAIRAGVGRIEDGVKLLTQISQIDAAIGVVGIGVTVIGFTVMARKIDQVKGAVDAMSDKIEGVSAKLDQIQRDAIDLDFAELKSLSKAFDEGWRLSGDAAVMRWHDVARGALSCQSRFEQRAGRLLVGGAAQYAAADPFLDAVSLSNALRVAALAACNESQAAQEAASDGARSLEKMTGAIGLADISLAALAERRPPAGTARWALTQAETNQTARATVRKIRHREAAGFTRAAPFALLEHRSIPPREWLAAARDEIESPVIMLLAET